MTANISGKKNAHSLRRLDTVSIILLAFCLSTLVLLLRSPSVTLEHMTSALSLCAKTVVPSLFPFMVISELLLSGDCASVLAPLLRRPAKFLFGVSGEGAVAIVLGSLCGFPIGAKGGAALYKSGRIDGEELERILTVSCIPSAPFLISTVGVSMFGDARVGIELLLACLLSSLLSGMGMKFFKFGSYKRNALPRQTQKREQGLAKLFTSAVSSSALSMLYICAFLTFFSTFVGVIENAVSGIVTSDATGSVLLGFFELTGGMKSASAVPEVGKYLAASVAGWSGLSVHFQIMSVCQGCDISFKPYFLTKIASAALCPAFMLVFDVVSLR